MDKTITGSCMCGRVSYQVTGPLRPICACHCTQCRKSSGHYSAATSASNDDLTISGDSLKWFQFENDDSADRGFCGHCGSNLFFRPKGKNRTSIFSGTIDGDTGLVIESQIFIEDKGDYYQLPDVPVIEQSELG
jgi:hypothetical protein